jgi:tubulin polyglutamylase TTLL4
MEVNVCPSLSSSSPMDRKIKHTLLTDILNIIGIEYNSKKSLQQLRKKEKERLFNYGNQDKRFYSKNINNLDQLNYGSCLDILSP